MNPLISEPGSHLAPHKAWAANGWRPPPRIVTGFLERRRPERWLRRWTRRTLQTHPVVGSLREAHDSRAVRNPAHAFQVLLDLTRRLTEADLALDDALSTVTGAALKLFDGQHASLRILDDTHTELLSGARRGAGTSERPVAFRKGEGVAGWVVEHGETARIDDVDQDERFIRFSSQGYRIRSLLAVPMWSAGAIIGCLTTTSDTLAHFDEDDELIGRLLANCAVPPIERTRLQRLALTDPQTSAWRSGYLMPRLQRELNLAESGEYPVSLLLMDLDHFKSVNDTHGHAAGDEVLIRFAELVRAQVRRDDVFVRRGGEEFVIIMPRCPLDVALGAAERIRASLAEHAITTQAGASIDQRVSIGVAEWDREEDAPALEARSDAAMYAAKRAGRDRVVG